MDLIDNISKAVLVIIRAGVAFRVALCFLRMATSEDDVPLYKKRIKNILIFYVLAECAFVIKTVVLFYYA